MTQSTEIPASHSYKYHTIYVCRFLCLYIYWCRIIANLNPSRAQQPKGIAAPGEWLVARGAPPVDW